LQQQFHNKLKEEKKKKTKLLDHLALFDIDPFEYCPLIRENEKKK
jgi:hypothetical protein